MTVQGQALTSLRTELGAQLRGGLEVTGRRVETALRVPWAHHPRRDAAIRVGPQDLPDAGFTVRGTRRDANSALISAGLAAPLNQRLRLAARVDGEASGNVTQIAGTVRLRLSL